MESYNYFVSCSVIDEFGYNFINEEITTNHKIKTGTDIVNVTKLIEEHHKYKHGSVVVLYFRLFD